MNKSFSGKSKSIEYPKGKRKIERSTGLELAPRSIRESKKYLKDCTEKDLEKAGIL